LSSSYDSEPILWESEDFICFLLILIIQVYDTIKFPDIPELAGLATLVQLIREPLVSNVSGFIDGRSFKIECSSDPGIQNAYYNGFTCYTCVKNH
jgi:hypothetical protein